MSHFDKYLNYHDDPKNHENDWNGHHDKKDDEWNIWDLVFGNYHKRDHDCDDRDWKYGNHHHKKDHKCDDWDWDCDDHHHKKHRKCDDWDWNCDDHHHKKHHRSESCICDKLRNLPGNTKVDIFLAGGQIIEDVLFIAIHEKNGCTLFSDQERKNGSTFIVDCQDIQSIRIQSQRLYHKL